MNDDSDQQDNPLASLSFAPSWAKDSSEHQFEDFRRRAARFEREGDDEGERRGGRRDFRRDRRNGADGPQRRRDGEFRRDGRDRDRRAGPDGSGPAGGERRRDFRRDFRRDGASGSYEQRTPPPFSVRFMPEQEALTFLARKIAASRKAMPLRDVADLFFKAPDTTLARLEMDEAHKDDKFHQCSSCGWFSRDEAELRRHLLAKHFSEYFEAVEIDGEAPSGKFSSVARCGVTGKLLAPPNHHSYNRRIAEMMETPECAGLSESEYRSRIEIVSDPEAIEQWRREAARKTLYRLVSKKQKPAPAASADAPAQSATPAAPEAPVEAPAESAPVEAPAESAAPEAPVEAAPVEASAESAAPEAPVEAPSPAESAAGDKSELLDRDKAEELFFAKFALKLCRHSPQVTISHKESAELTDRQALAAIRRAWDHEQLIHVASLFFAVRAGLKARKLSIFRNRDQRRDEFVSFRAPTSIDPSVAVPELREVLDWVAANPNGDKASLLAALAPADAPAERQEAVRTQLAFAIDRGAVLEFASGPLVLGASLLPSGQQSR